MAGHTKIKASSSSNESGRFNHWYDYLNPLNYIGQMGDNLSDGYDFGDFSAGLFGIDTRSSKNESEFTKVLDPQQILGEVGNDSREQFIEDREHTELREDTAYQRAVEDMREAGLNPYTVGASPAASSRSQVGEMNIGSKISLLGYLLDLKNLDFKNKELINNAVSGLVKTGIMAKSRS